MNEPVDISGLKTIVVDINNKRVEGIVQVLMRLTQFQPQLKLIPSDGCHETEVAVMLGSLIYDDVMEAIKKIQTEAEVHEQGK